MKLHKAVDLPQRISDDPCFLFRPHKDEAKNSLGPAERGVLVGEGEINSSQTVRVRWIIVYPNNVKALSYAESTSTLEMFLHLG